MYPYSQDDLDNHANQLNPNNDAYWQSRGFDERPGAWDDDDDWNDLSLCSEDLDDAGNWDYEDWCSDDFE